MRIWSCARRDHRPWLPKHSQPRTIYSLNFLLRISSTCELQTHLAAYGEYLWRMEKSDNSIYRWLSRVTEDGQAPGASGARLSSGAPYTCPSLTGFADDMDDDGPAHPLKSFSESMDLTPQFRGLHPKKRTRDTPTREEPPRDEPRAAKPINEYERKPRHKTRKDRYKYKTTGSSRGGPSELPEQKAKRQRRSRKQSMNDGFHASNVARNRLTVWSLPA